MQKGSWLFSGLIRRGAHVQDRSDPPLEQQLDEAGLAVAAAPDPRLVQCAEQLPHQPQLALQQGLIARLHQQLRLGAQGRHRLAQDK